MVTVAGSPLEGRTSRRRNALTVKQPGGEVVVEALLNTLAKPSLATFEIAAGGFRFQRPETEKITYVYDAAGEAVARRIKGAVELRSGETLAWEESTFVRVRYRLGDELWVAKPHWPAPNRGFRADLSDELLARPDRDLLVGIAAVLTQWGIETKAAIDSVGSPA